MSFGTLLQTNLEPQTVSLGWEIVVLTVVTLAVMIGIGWYSYRKNVGADAEEFLSSGFTYTG